MQKKSEADESEFSTAETRFLSNILGEKDGFWAVFDLCIFLTG
jgi:hypothetical protein